MTTVFFLLLVSGYCTASLLPYYNAHNPADIHLEMNGFMAQSCLDYLNHGQSKSGFYQLWDKGQRYLAYCDFASEPGSAWTLVMSWSLQHKHLPHFRNKTFMQDAPINHKTPNWEIYRQPLARMKSIRRRSTHWRATCWFNHFDFGTRRSHFSYEDYLRGKFRDFDIMTWVGSGTCQPVDYVNIRGNSAYGGQTAPFWQAKDQYTLHIDSSQTKCDLKANGGPYGQGAVQGENNFGYYGTVGKNFKCTYYNYRTTQWWFGGYLDEQ
ncbi:hypothetical protein ACROYT_G040938 [Oculina patagonica]